MQAALGRGRALQSAAGAIPDRADSRVLSAGRTSRVWENTPFTLKGESGQGIPTSTSLGIYFFINYPPMFKNLVHASEGKTSNTYILLRLTNFYLLSFLKYVKIF